MLPMTHHKTHSQSTPFKQSRSNDSRPRFTIPDALLQVAIGELKTREAIHLVISLAANESLTEECSGALGAIAGKAGCRKTDNPYDLRSQRKLFAAFERGLTIGRSAAKGARKPKNKPKQPKATMPKAVPSYRRKRLH